MSTHDDQLREAVSDLANALQAAAPLATRLRRELSEQAQDLRLPTTTIPCR